MEVKGRVLGVPRESSFASKKKGEEGKQITMLYFDVYDVTAKLCQCEMVKDSLELKEDDKIIAEVVRWKEQQFQNGGLVFSLRNVRPWNGEATVPTMPAPPAHAAAPSAPPAAPEPSRRPAPPR